jgi:hypothetical protein
MSGTGDPIVDDQPWPAVLPPELTAFLAYWQGLADAAGGGTPPKRMIDALQMPRTLLPGIGLIDWLPQPDGRVRLYYRLLGTAHRRATGHDYTGRYFDDLYTPAQVARLQAEYAAILAGGQPRYARRASLKQSREFVMFQRILAPLLDDAGHAHHLIGFWYWEPADP